MSEPLFFLCSFPVNFAGKNGGGGCEMSTSERGVCVCEKEEKEKKSVKEHLLWPTKEGDKGVWCVVVVNWVVGARGGSKKILILYIFFQGARMLHNPHLVLPRKGDSIFFFLIIW